MNKSIAKQSDQPSSDREIVSRFKRLQEQSQTLLLMTNQLVVTMDEVLYTGIADSHNASSDPNHLAIP